MKARDMAGIVKTDFTMYKTTGNGVFKQECKAHYNEYKALGGTRTLNDIIKSNAVQA